MSIMRPTDELRDDFDLWLHQRLKDMYDSVASEEIPPHMRELIEEGRRRQLEDGPDPDAKPWSTASEVGTGTGET